MDTQTRQLVTTLRPHDGLITRRQAAECGLSAADIQGYLDRATWQRVHRNVYRATAAPSTPKQRLRAACLACGEAAVASHRSAAWLWNLIERPPDRPEITVSTSWIPKIKGVRVHRSRDLDATRTIVRNGIPTTDPLRTVVDLGAELAVSDLSDVLDRSLATRLITLRGVVAELNRLSRQGRPGLGHLRLVITECGLAGAPHPSVLESRTLRLLIDHGLPVPAIEVTAGPDGEYRLDFADPVIKLAIEVDGYVRHFTPEHQRRDHRRRNRLNASGWHTLVFTWIDITRHPHEVAAQIQATRRSMGAT
jgi:hypothetical protein